MTTYLSTSSSMRPLPSLLPSTGPPPFVLSQVALRSTLTPLILLTCSTHSRHPIPTTQCLCQLHLFESNTKSICKCFLLRGNVILLLMPSHIVPLPFSENYC